MSRYDPKMTAASPAPAELDELLLALGSAAGAGIDRRDTMARFLSGSDGWRDARAVLRGAFAKQAAVGADGSSTEQGLIPDQDK